MGDQAPQTPLEKALARCDALGLAACVVGACGDVVQVRTPDDSLRLLLSTPQLRERVREEARRLVRHLGADGAGEIASVTQGVWIGAAPIESDSGTVDLVVPVFIGREASRSPLLLACARVLGIGAERLAFVLAPSACFDERTAGAMARAVSLSAIDVCSLSKSAEDRKSFTEQLSGAYDTIDVLYSLGHEMRSPHSPRAFLKSLCQRSRTTLRLGWVAGAFTAGGETPAGLRGALVVDGAIPSTEHVCREAMLALLRDMSRSCRIRDHVRGLSSDDSQQVVTQTLMCRGKPIGVLAAGGRVGPDSMLSSYDTQLFEACAGFLITFVENVALYEDQRDLFMGTLRALTAAIDAKDRYTFGHSERVALLSWQLAQAAGLPPEQAERVRIAGLVHDVGKIGVPEDVLIKPGSLTEAEFASIKLHPEIGHRILQPVPQLQDVLPGVLHHHERYDGRGYPHRIAGESIPLVARIIGVADTFDAMSSDRSYRQRLTRPEVLAEIARSAGTQLDPRLAQLLLTLDLRLYDEASMRHAATHAAANAA